MIRLRRARVLSVAAAHPGLRDLTVELDGSEVPAVAYDALTGLLEPGDTVIVNTTAVELGLGTGGVHFVVAVSERDVVVEGSGHAVKARYTPLQVAVQVAEEGDLPDDLGGMPVVVAGLHSALAPAALGVRAAAADARIAYVMTDGGALPIAFSRTVPALRAAGLIATTITCGQSFGGDLEAVTVYGGLAAARAHADVAIVAMGPGNLGTASRLGFALIETAAIVNAVASLGGRPIVVPRLSFADRRERHRGISHHTLTAMELALARATIVLPRLEPDRDAHVRAQLGRLDEKHDIVTVDVDEGALSDAPVDLRSMGRGYADDPDMFRAAAAAGAYAARAL